MMMIAPASDEWTAVDGMRLQGEDTLSWRKRAIFTMHARQLNVRGVLGLRPRIRVKARQLKRGERNADE